MGQRAFLSGFLGCFLELQGIFFSSQASAAEPAIDALKQALTFHASFDHKPDADHARGDGRIYTASNASRQDARPGLARGDVSIVPGKGRFGGALQFGRKDKPVIFFQADKNFPYQAKDWNGSVSFWLSLDPDRDLGQGFSDPIQITDKKWDDAAFFVDFTREVPKNFRLGVYADTRIWNPTGRKFDDIPTLERPFSEEIKNPPFARDRWTHVVFTFESFNTGKADGVAKLYLDGQLRGLIRDRRQTFTWDPSRAAIMLGLSYIGLMDDLAIFDRALTTNEVTALNALDGGVATVRSPR